MLCDFVRHDYDGEGGLQCARAMKPQPPIRIPYKRAVQGQLHFVMTTTTMNHNLSAGCTGDAMSTVGRSFLKSYLRCLEGPFKLSSTVQGLPHSSQYLRKNI